MRRKKSAFDSPEPTFEMEADFESVSRFFLDLRGVGHFLAPQDSRLLMEWLERGVPPRVLTQGMHIGWERLRGDGRSVRSLRSVERDIKAQIKNHWALRPGKGEAEPENKAQVAPAARPSQNEGPRESYVASQVRVLREIAEESRADGRSDWVKLCEGALDEIRQLEAGGALKAPGALIPGLLSTGRRLYDGILLALLPEEHRALRAEAEASMEGWIRPISEDAREEAIQELMITGLRSRLQLFDPTDLFSLWGA